MLRRRPGFSLIEVLLYTAFVGIIMLSMVLVANTAFSIKSRLRASQTLEQNIRFATLRMAALTAEATDISTPTIGNSSGTLILTMPNAAQNPTTFSNVSGTILLQQGASGTWEMLTSNEVSVSSLTFTRTSSTLATVRVVVSAALRNTTATYGTLTVTTTAATRY